MDILIPIAKSNKTGKTVFIDDVPSGMACDCHCIGCDVPLVARKGEIKIHHFSHAPKKVNKKHHCPFSFERSVFWMIREVLTSAQQSKQINLPSYIIKYQDKLIAAVYQKQVTNRHQVSFDKVEFSKPLDKTSHADMAIITVAGYPLAITFSLKKALSYSPYFWQKSGAYIINGQPIAHLQVDLSGLQKIFSRRKRDYRDILADLIFDSYGRKSWLYHPNEQVFRLEFEGQVNKALEEKKQVQELFDLAVKKDSVAQEILTKERNKKFEQERIIAAKKEILSKTVLQYNIPKPMGYAEQKQIKETMLNNSHSRLQELLEQAEAFRKQGNSTGNRCQCCYFMNSSEQQSCQYCQSDSLLKVALNEDYFKNIERKYDCGCYGIFSVKALANING